MPHPGAYRGNKRQKELKRLAKQEEKRQKRLLKKDGDTSPEEELVPLDGPVNNYLDETPAGSGEEAPPVLHKEDLVYEFVELKQRSYK